MNQKQLGCSMKALALVIVFLLAISSSFALVSVSQMGYHPSGQKQVVWYTSSTSGTFTVRDAGNNPVLSGALAKATDISGNPVQCQGNNPCLIGDFSSLTTPGTYTIIIGGETSPQFSISNTVYSSTAPLFSDFFNALSQQGSAFHADMNSGFTPAFPAMADGSFLMTADQASLTLIRLGSAYRRNPQMLQSNKYGSPKPDIQETIRQYADYLRGLQGLAVTQRTDGIGFRLNPNVETQNAFVPGPTSMTQLNVYIPGGSHQLLKTVPVRSLCGADDGSAAWDTCINEAAQFYKCQIDEPCLNLTYIEKTGVITGNNNGYAVSQGWLYEFGCYFDVQLQQPAFNGQYNPCMIFDPKTSRADTSRTLLAYLEALPALYDYDPAIAQSYFNRAVQTNNYVKSSYPAFATNDADAGFYGATQFLLYDYTGNTQYLQDAYSMRALIPTSFVSDMTRGNEFYWEEYVRHKSQLQALGLTYTVGGTNPEEFFRGKMFFDYKDMGPNAMMRTAERIFQFDPNIQFQNSRYQLTEGLLAAKTLELRPGSEQFITTIADNQLAWLTGMNGVQQGVGSGVPVRSYSFIFGIGQFPQQFHTRLLVNTGYKSASGGRVIGTRGTDLQFFNGTDYVYLDGMASVLGKTFGSNGNSYRNEAPTKPFVVGQTFANGKNYIPGWINGAFDSNSDTDVIYNYRDDLGTYEYTESTNEIVATALEYLAYLDAQRNSRAAHAPITFSVTAEANGTLSLSSTPSAASVLIDGTIAGTTPQSFSLAPGIHTLQVSSPGYVTSNSSVNINSAQTTTLSVVLTPLSSSNSTNTSGACYSSVQSIPATCTGALTQDTWDGCRHLTCASGGNSVQVLACDKGANFEMYKQAQTGSGATVCLAGTCISDNGYAASGPFPICTGNTTTPAVQNGTLQVSSSPSGNVFVNSVLKGSSPLSISLAPGTYTISVTQSGYVTNSTSATITQSATTSVALTLRPINSTNSNSTGVCYTSVQNIPASCAGGSITQDSWNGCRTVVCSAAGSSLTVLACDKSGFFEMYRSGSTGSPTMNVCIGQTCLGNGGYVKSTNFPICSGNATDTSAPVISNGQPTGAQSAGTTQVQLSVQTNEAATCAYSTIAGSAYNAMTPFSSTGATTHSSTISGLQNGQSYTYYVKCQDAFGNANSNDFAVSFSVSSSSSGNPTAQMRIAPWYPQGRNYVFQCVAGGMTPTYYDFYFGDGQKALFRTTNDVYYTYAAAGSYNAYCVARNGAVQATGTLTVQVV
jgi:hypothetical protein